jgi:hypothetical protein
MAGYTVNARIERAGVHLAATSRPAPDVAADRRDDAQETVDLVGRPIEEVLAERWAMIRESWAQTTFFLFDPESWR